MANRLALSACALLLLCGGAAAKPGIAASTVNLRAEANTTSAVVTKIPGGARIDVGDCNDGWCAVTFQGKSGFAIATALDTTGRVRRASARGLVRQGLPPGYDPYDDDEYVPVAPGYGPRPYVVGPPPLVYGPGFYGPGPYWGWGGGWGYRGWGYRRW
jgi:hypothetical protein